MSSPFDTILAPYIDQLHPSLREQYLCPADAAYEIVLGGKMKCIWHRPVWLWPIFWCLALGNVFFPETGEDVPTHLIVTPTRNQHGTPIQIWKRTFYFPNAVRRQYISTMIHVPDTNRIIELQGPNNIFEETAEIRVTPPATIEFLTVESTLNVGSLRVPLPRRLWVTAHVVQTAVPEQHDVSQVTFTLTHHLLGPVFGYEGVFRKTRRQQRRPVGGASI